jgi:hypothetical protein
MSSTHQSTPASAVQMGHARTDITPPVGIYHPMWGAARHHRATGIHRPLFADILVFAPSADADIGNRAPWVQVQIDMVGLGSRELHESMRDAVADGAKVDPAQVVFAYSHTHAGGLFSPDRVHLPGGDMILPYLDEVRAKLYAAAEAARADLAEAILTYGTGSCTLARNRDFWDTERQIYACGFNPDQPTDDTLLVVRATAPDGTLRATVVNYACHPTTLAWDNTLISPDYVGALRETVESATGAPCIFTLGACGDIGPRQGFVGDTAVADANGREVAYAALSVLTAMDPAGQDFAYQGPVVSGATLGAWGHAPWTEARRQAARLYRGGNNQVELQQIPRPDPAKLEQEMQHWLSSAQQADSQGEAIAARDFGARAERARRWLQRLRNLPAGPTYPFGFTVRRMGDAYWVSCGGEPYNFLQTSLRAAFPDHPIVLTVMAGELSVAYLLTAESYGKGLYQEEPSILAAGCLEELTEAVIDSIEELAG